MSRFALEGPYRRPMPRLLVGGLVVVICLLLEWWAL
jgi:hypothetical protein